MTNSMPPVVDPADAKSQRSGDITISRRTLIVGAVILVVALIAAALGVGYAVGAGSSSDPGNAESTSSRTPAASSAPIASEPEPELEPEVETFGFGDTFTTGNVTLTVNSFDAVDSIATTEGSPITADAGGQLFLVKMTYSNSKTQADLSCGNTDLYLQAYDTLEREMAPIFELSRIPGNPGCNDHLLQDTAHEWSYVFQSVAGASPLALSVIESDKWLEPVWVDLQQ